MKGPCFEAHHGKAKSKKWKYTVKMLGSEAAQHLQRLARNKVEQLDNQLRTAVVEGSDSETAKVSSAWSFRWWDGARISLQILKPVAYNPTAPQLGILHVLGWGFQLFGPLTRRARVPICNHLTQCPSNQVCQI